MKNSARLHLSRNAAPLTLNAKATLLLLAGISLASAASDAAARPAAKLPAAHSMSSMTMPMAMPMASAAGNGAKAKAAASVEAADASSTLPTVNVTNVIVDNDSAKIQFQPVAGAADYRVYDVSNPSFVKYAGIRQNDLPNVSHITSQPALEVEWNGMTPGTTATLVVEAVDAVGPVSQGALYGDQNNALYPSMQTSMSMLGIDEGMTIDNKTSINGQGPYTNSPNAIARSRAFIVTPAGTPTLPSGSDATQVAYDTFTSGTFTKTDSNPDNDGMSAKYTLQSDLLWDIKVEGADTIDTMPFVMGHHFMDVLFDGGTPGTNNPLHVTSAALGLSPQQTADVSGGKMLHVTWEVDSHVASRRWTGIILAPANDPLTSFNGSLDGHIHQNASNQLFVMNPTSSGYSDTLDGLDANGLNTAIPIVGAPGQALHNGTRSMDGSSNWNGRGLDDRSRIDFFITQTHFAQYEDGVLQESYDIPGGLPFSQIKVYFVHFTYDAGEMLSEEKAYTPYETDWINNVQYSDERHWDNMGFEVLPAATTWDSLSSRIGTPDPLARDGSSLVAPFDPPTYVGTVTGDTTETVVGEVKRVKTQAGNTSTYLAVLPATGPTVYVKTTDGAVATSAVAAYTYNTTVTITYTVSSDPRNNGKIQTLVIGK